MNGVRFIGLRGFVEDVFISNIDSHCCSHVFDEFPVDVLVEQTCLGERLLNDGKSMRLLCPPPSLQSQEILDRANCPEHVMSPSKLATTVVFLLTRMYENGTERRC